MTIFYTAPTLVRSLMRDGNEVRNLSNCTCEKSVAYKGFKSFMAIVVNHDKRLLHFTFLGYM